MFVHDLSTYGENGNDTIGTAGNDEATMALERGMTYKREQKCNNIHVAIFVTPIKMTDAQ